MSRQTARWEEPFRTMEREWIALEGREVAHLMDEWRPAMQRLTREYNGLVFAGLWVTGPADLLSVIHRQRCEVTHSRFLAWLLTPTRRHSLGNSLLQRLLKYCGESLHHVQPTVRRVTCEYTRNDRRADIIVWGDGFTLVIENKVDADEQPAQCDDLYANFKNEPGPLFLFLTPDGRPPKTATSEDAREAFKTISWPRLRSMIEDVARHAASPATAGAALVGNYTVTLKEQFG